MNLFVDTSNNYFIALIFNNKQIIDSIRMPSYQNQSELFYSILPAFFKKNGIKVTDFDNYYFASGPGSFTGIRMGLSFAKALCCSNIKNIFMINSLDILFDNYDDSKALIDARGGKYYVKVIDDKLFSETKIVDKDDLDDIDSYNTYETSLNNVFDNVINLVNMGRYEKEIKSTYIKESF
ncbi:MAG: tRNA (adenosine(37)-N6)-threonylcarbamoyltransferase complex dimerization subunit type 1 TsaB [Bacilli bacterium]|jgi:tRNA threonylcarbamoyl adenosine modification protein YeaZ|nr:tRNA (adenosine(37)-N6)-threonylcarbamoyltransferase complex dimerization subunit type 1 TsaB [Bacilli bacterium]